MRRFAGVVLGGVLAQAAILGTFGQLSPHHPGAVVVAFRVSTTGLIGGYVAAALGTHHPLRTATAAGGRAGGGGGGGAVPPPKARAATRARPRQYDYEPR
ncbi:hypothetical protein PNP85_13500, partial [Halobacterium salinarum]|uniref:hypothetical protein n=1 Tax=Halobacterium salinarum TaxID=2242 RepID=UPI00255650E1